MLAIALISPEPVSAIISEKRRPRMSDHTNEHRIPSENYDINLGVTGFVLTPPKRLVPLTSALGRAATPPLNAVLRIITEIKHA
ncbi:hypothetical protein EVAR_86773_1 [Eumeta japonica]|uniref:Uncharacterized protein n=1 Tax=Eumeta variegata TaxID=151549 RepID=A0A4C1W237_EUMVA|nr:hypothetical protein EVAR_86773_1 [Eumeta japonica]